MGRGSLLLGCWLVTCSLSPGRPAHAAPPFPPPDRILAALAGLPGAELILFEAVRAGQPTRVLAAGRVRAAPARVRAVLGDPQAYRRAVPSFRRADVVFQRGPVQSPDLLVAWELEVPLWNLAGKLWLQPVADGVDIDLIDGDMSPGLLALRVTAVAGGALLSIEGHANVREANWASRRIAARSPLAEPAMSAAAIWSLLRALVLEAERGTKPDPRRNPTAAIAAPPARALDGSALAKVATQLEAGRTIAAVRSRADGRLDRIEVAVPTEAPLAVVRRALADPRSWRSLPGWKEIKVSGTGWQVDSQLPFVNFDALWSVQPGPPFRAVAVGGDTRGAVLGWDLTERAPRGTVAVFSFHPRLEKSGYIPRKFIEAEPLLEHGMSLGLAYVDAVSWVRALPQGAQ